MKLMMARKSFDKVLGEIDAIGHKEFDHDDELCSVRNEPVDGYYMGTWVLGMAIGCIFPESEVRELTEAEVEHFSGVRLGVGNNEPLPLRMEPSEDGPKHWGKTPEAFVAGMLASAVESA